MTYVSKAGFEAKKISHLIDDSDEDKLKSSTACNIKQMSFDTDDNVTYSFNLSNGVLYYSKAEGSTTTINNRKIAEHIDYIEVNPIKSGVNYDTCNGIHIKINFLNKSVNYLLESDIYFRNTETQE